MTASDPAMGEVAGGHLAYLDGWRGVAISLLLVGHFFPVPGINLGTLGVNFFFVLSGYLMAGLLFLKSTPIDIFYRRRIARIIPAHLVFVVSVTLVWAMTAKDVSFSETFAALFFVNNYVGSEPGQSVMPLGHIWSLSVEEQGYILLSLLAIASRKRLINARFGIDLMALICACFAFVYSVTSTGRNLQFNLWLHTEVAGYGIFLSGFVLLMSQANQRIWPRLTVPALVVFGVMLHWWSVPLAIQKVFGVGALALAVNFLSQSPLLLRRALSWTPLRYLGLWSFSLYIWQQPFYLWSGSEHMPPSVGLLSAFVVGLASYYLVENPARQYLNRVWGHKKTIAAAVT